MRTTGWLTQAAILIFLVLISDYSQGKTRAGATGLKNQDMMIYWTLLNLIGLNLTGWY